MNNGVGSGKVSKIIAIIYCMTKVCMEKSYR